MNERQLMEILGNAFRDGQFDELKQVLHPEAIYSSDYANLTLEGADDILAHMERIYSLLDSTNAYTYEIVSKESVLCPGEDWDAPTGMRVSDYVLILRQYIPEYPVAVVLGVMTDDGRLSEMYIERDSDVFALDFYHEQDHPDSPDDLPSSVTPMSGKDRFVAAAKSWEQGQRWEKSEPDDDLYIWRRANAFAERWLPQKGYSVAHSAVFADCIGYRCTRGEHECTVFMYAYGQRKTSQLDGDFCAKLATLPFAKDSTVLVLYVKVNRYLDGDTMRYQVLNYCGMADREPDLWQLKEVNGRYILVFYPSQEMMDQMWSLMYAFNREDKDVYDCILSRHHLWIEGIPPYPGVHADVEFYRVLRQLHQEYGDMEAGYVRYNDVVYSEVPYIEDVGFFGWHNYNDTNRMYGFFCRPFSNGEIPVAEFIYAGMREPDDLFDYIPELVAAEPLPPIEMERLAAKLYFADGTCRKWVLPVRKIWDGSVFAFALGRIWWDEMWASMKRVPRRKYLFSYPDCRPGIVWNNGFSVSGMQCWLESELYSEPTLIDEVVYEDESYQLRKLWQWNVHRIDCFWGMDILRVNLGTKTPGQYGKYLAISLDGKRIHRPEFDVFDDFHCGRARVGIGGRGYGFVDEEMNVVIPLQYERADDFFEFITKVQHDGRTFFINSDGEEIPPKGAVNWSKYQEVGKYVEGMCRVSTLCLRGGDLAYYSDYGDVAGIWGFVNEAGEEVVRPQYIYAYDFEQGLALVAKGKWTISPEWDNEYAQGRYWTAEELWGAIDQDGNEVIPLIFDEMRWFEDRRDIFAAHYGGWKDGHWGVIDDRGNWLAEPVFADIGYEAGKDLVVFYTEDPWTNDDAPRGVYDLTNRKVLLEAQFLYIDFDMNGDIIAEMFDEKLGRRVKKIFDRNGKERFPSVYSDICSSGAFYEVKIGSLCGLVDADGRVVLPCEYRTGWYGIQCKQRRVYFIDDDGLMGVKDFEGNVIIPAMYEYITYWTEALLRVTVKGKKQGLLTHDGREVLPAVYDEVQWRGYDNQEYILTHGENGYIMYRLERRENAAEEHA